MEGARVMRRSVTLADQLAAVGPPPLSPPATAGSCNLRDLLKLRDEDDLAAAGRRAAAVTLASAMAAERQASLPTPMPSTSSAAAAAARTLLDIIRDDHLQQTPHAPGDADAAAGDGDTLVRRAVSLPAPTTTASSSPPASAAAPNETAPSSPPGPAPPPPPRPASQPPAPSMQEAEEEQGERVSLMALLEQTDRQWSAVAPPGEEDLTEAEAPELVDDDDAAEPAAGKGVVAGCCCVCMARAKGAAFIPCGHTFCRFCARELLAGRGRCPLCNAAIVDVLDIF
ncbi:hypothetical protein HU200_061917 [Digitaria exilis]|uniref:RING-type domain-containing protein n=1 Tax=Digitaria exilis TaxID=1010633 RepID=A0A835A6W1_9POAL|nr:hypothetical protein HU200_061917 [Digitaria exilis]